MSNTVPDGWKVRSVDEVATVFAGGTPSRSKPEYYDGKVPWVKSGEVNTRIIYRTEEFISELAVKESSARWAKKGSVLVAMYGATAGKVARLMIDATLNQAVSAINGREGFAHNGFLLYAIENNTRELLNTVQGSGQPNLSGQLIKSLDFPVPPLSEQQKIATILSTVDDVIEKTHAQIDKLKDLKTGMMQELLTKGIGPGGVPHTEFKDSPVGRIPVGWVVVCLRDIQSKEKYSCVGGPFGSDLTSKHYVENAGVPVIRGANLPLDSRRFLDHGFVYVSEEKAESLIRNMAYRGDLVFTQRGTLGQVGLIPENSRYHRYVISQSQMKLTVDESVADREFLYQFFLSSKFLGMLKLETIATGLPHINLGILKGFYVPLPPIDEQEKIARILVSMDHKSSLLLAKIESQIGVKKSLMQDLLTGKVRVNTNQEFGIDVQ
jgi:type I restriction enzyme S subunit